MNKAILILFVSFITQIMFSQKINNFDSPSENHSLVEGTSIYLISPKDFIKSTSFIGFKHPNNKTSMIMIMEIPGPFKDIVKGFNKQSMEGSGMNLISKKEVTINQYNGLLINIEQDSNGLTYSKYLLVYGNDKSTTMINGIFLKDSTEDAVLIKESINSVVIGNSDNTDPRASLDFSVNEKLGNLIFTSMIGKGLLLNRDGKTPTESDDKATLIINKSFSNLKIDDKKSFCISRLEELPYHYNLIDESKITDIEINNLKGFALFAKSPKYKNELLYQVILFKENGGYYIFVGTYVEQSEKALNDIKKVINSFSTS